MSNQDPYQQPSGAGWQPGSFAAPAYSPQGDAYGTPPPYTGDQYGTPPPPPFQADPFGAPQAQHPAFASYGTPAAPPYGYPAGPQYAAPTYGYPLASAPTYAHWGLRVAAMLLDLLGVIPYWVGAFVSGMLSTPGYDQFGQPTSVSTPAGSAALAIGALVSLALWVWNRGFQQSRTGQSWGKKVVGLRLARDETGENVGVWRALLRDLAHWLDCWIFGLGFWFPLWDAKRQTFADKIVKTVSVR